MRAAARDIGGALGASGIATALDGFVFLFLATLGCAAWFGALCAAAAGAVTHYSLSRFGVFRRFEARIGRSAARYAAMSSGAAVVYAAGAEVVSPHWGPVAAWVALKIVIFAAITYPLSRYWVFGRWEHA